MRIIPIYDYGADADGNRGMTMYEYELEDDDYEVIYEQIAEQYEEDKTEYSVVLYNHMFDLEIEEEVDIYDWLSSEDIDAIKETNI